MSKIFVCLALVIGSLVVYNVFIATLPPVKLHVYTVELGTERVKLPRNSRIKHRKSATKIAENVYENKITYFDWEHKQLRVHWTRITYYTFPPIFKLEYTVTDIKGHNCTNKKIQYGIYSVS